MEVISKRWLGHSAGRAWIAFTVAILGVALIATASPARAQFGTVTLTQSGTSVNFDVVLNAGFFFQETADGDEALVFFNDSLPGSTITNIVATLNGSIVNIPGGLSGFTNLPGVVTSAGTFTALVECTVPSDCDAASNLFINDLHFTVTKATLAQLEVANDAGNFFAVSLPLSELPEPATFALLGIGLAGIGFAKPRRLN